jgi:hypothetical protein
MIAQEIDFAKIIAMTPAQYTRLISISPPANKSVELHRINVLVIEIGFPKKFGLAVPTQTQFLISQIVKTTK